MTPEPVLTHLTDTELLERADSLAATDRSVNVSLIRTLREIDDRRLFLPLGFSCMFYYCTQRLRFSEHAAYNRIEVARVSRVYPAVLDALESGALTLTTAILLAPHLTPDNEAELLGQARFKSKRDVQRLLAARREPGAEPFCFVMHFSVDEATYGLFQHARSLLRHQIPDGDTATIFKRSMALLVADIERRKFSNVKRPRGSGSVPRGRHIPAHVERAVWRRDAARCAFRGPMGRCTERDFLEFHHVRPFAEGGPATVENIELRCRAHNAYEAELMFPA